MVLSSKNSSEKKNSENQIKFKKFIQMAGKLGCNFNLKNENGYAPLHLAAQQNNYAGVLNLLTNLTIDIHVCIINQNFNLFRLKKFFRFKVKR